LCQPFRLKNADATRDSLFNRAGRIKRLVPHGWFFHVDAALVKDATNLGKAAFRQFALEGNVEVMTPGERDSVQYP
jgi:hypothetical protein